MALGTHHRKQELFKAEVILAPVPIVEKLYCMNSEIKRDPFESELVKEVFQKKRLKS